MSIIPWILISIGLLAILAIVLAMNNYKGKGKKHEPDYYTFFIIGIIYFIMGVALNYNVLWMLGVVFMLVGLVNKDKWKKNHRTWKKLDKKERKLMIWALLLGCLLFFAGLIIFFSISS